MKTFIIKWKGLRKRNRSPDSPYSAHHMTNLIVSMSKPCSLFAWSQDARASVKQMPCKARTHKTWLTWPTAPTHHPHPRHPSSYSLWPALLLFSLLIYSFQLVFKYVPLPFFPSFFVPIWILFPEKRKRQLIDNKVTKNEFETLKN